MVHLKRSYLLRAICERYALRTVVSARPSRVMFLPKHTVAIARVGLWAKIHCQRKSQLPDISDTMADETSSLDQVHLLSRISDDYCKEDLEQFHGQNKDPDLWQLPILLKKCIFLLLLVYVPLSILFILTSLRKTSSSECPSGTPLDLFPCEKDTPKPLSNMPDCI